MKVIGKTVYLMVLEKLLIKMEISLKENLLMVKEKVKVDIKVILMNIKVIGKMEK